MEVGGKVFYDGHLPKSVPGIFQLESRQNQLETLKSKISVEKYVGDVVQWLEINKITGEKNIAEKGFNYLKMKQGNETWYLIINCGLKPADEWVEMKTPAKSFVIYNPMNGEINNAQKKGNAVRIQLDPEQSIFIRCSSKKINVPLFEYHEKSNEPLQISGAWKVDFVSGGPVLPESMEFKKLTSWTNNAETDANIFAGTAKYKTEFAWNNNSKTAFLDLGTVKDCARVKLNGKNCGTLLGPVFKIKLDNLAKGKNTLEVEVTNVAANRIRDLDIRGVNWKNFYDINIVNIDYLPFDASKWEIREAGLLGPVTIWGI